MGVVDLGSEWLSHAINVTLASNPTDCDPMCPDTDPLGSHALHS